MKQPAAEHVKSFKVAFNAFLRDPDLTSRANLILAIERYYNEAEKRNRPGPSPVVINDADWTKAGYPED